MPSSMRPAWTWARPPSASAFVSSSTSPKRRARSRASSAAASSSSGSSTSQPIPATATQPCSMHGGSSATRRRARANQARLAGRLPSVVAIMSPRRADATAARRLSPAAVSSRTAVERWARSPSTSKLAIASPARASAASPAANRSPAVVTRPASRPGYRAAVATDGALTAADLVDRRVAVHPLGAARARQAEERRQLDDEVLAAIHASGVFRHFVPRRYGGLQLGVGDFVEIVLPLAESCASTAWVTSFLMEHNLILSLFPQRTQDEVFGAQPYVMAPGAAFPPGRAVPVEGGFVVSGRWSYASGVRHSDWAMGTALVDGAERPDMRWVLVPIEAVQVHDVWHVDGMAATGSDDFSMVEVFVPDHRTLRLS